MGTHVFSGRNESASAQKRKWNRKSLGHSSRNQVSFLFYYIKQNNQKLSALSQKKNHLGCGLLQQPCSSDSLLKLKLKKTNIKLNVATEEMQPLSTFQYIWYRF